jgi:hypothetical protein
MPAAPNAHGIVAAFSELSPSPIAVKQKQSDPCSLSCHCVVEDLYGRPASRPLSLSLTPERMSMPQFARHDVPVDSFVSPVYDKEMRLSQHNFPSPDQVAFFSNHSSISAAGGRGGTVVAQDGAGAATQHGNMLWSQSAAAVPVVHQRSGATSHSRNGHTTVASSVSGLHVTQSGIVIPPIQGIPQPKGLPPPTPVQYAKVKGKGKAGPKRSRLAVKGAFSNMTSVAVLQQVQPFQRKTPQVEAVGWSRLDFVPSADAADDDRDDEEHFVASGVSNTMGTSPAARNPIGGEQKSSAPPPATTTTATATGTTSASGLMVHQVALLNHAATRPSRSTSAASQTSLTPSEAAMVAAAWEEDVAAAAAAAASASQVQPTNSASANFNVHHSSYIEDQDEWDRAEEEAMRIQAQMLQQQRSQGAVSLPRSSSPSASVETPQPQQRQESNPARAFTPKAPMLLHAVSPKEEMEEEEDVIQTSPNVVRYDDPTDEVAPYAVRTAASANRSPTVVRRPPTAPTVPPPPPHTPSPGPVICSVHRLGSSQREETDFVARRLESNAARETPPDLPAAAQGAGAVQVKAVRAKSPADDPAGFKCFAEKGQQRKAEAERAQRVRTAAAAGEPIPAHHAEQPSPTPTRGNAGHSRRNSTQTRKMSVMPPPRGFEAYAQKGHARRAEWEREEERRQKEEAVNCTYVPRINLRTSLTTTANAADSAVADTMRSVPGATSADKVEPCVSVFDRLSKEAERRGARLRHLAEKFTPTFTPQCTTTAATAPPQDGNLETAATDKDDDTACTAGQSVKPRNHSRNVFEDLYALSKKHEKAATPSRSEDGGGATEDAAAVVTGGDAHTKKSKAEIQQYIAQMLNREEERRTRRAQQIAAKAAEEERHASHPTLNPKTSELAERARARYRAREAEEALCKHQQEEARAAAGRVAQRQQRHASELPSQGQKPPPVSTAASHAAKDTEASQDAFEKTTAVAVVSVARATTPRRRCVGAEFYEHQQKTELRKHRQLEELRLQKAEEELKECTFRPRLNAASERIAQRVLVESHDVPDDDDETPRMLYQLSRSVSPQETVLVPRHRSSSSSRPRSVDVSCHNGQSPLVSAHSRSLLHELRALTSTEGPTAQDLSCAAASNDGEMEEEEEEFTLQVQPIHLHAADTSHAMDGVTPQRSPEPLSMQLRILEEMLLEWKELERECSPMLRQRPQARMVE